VTPPTDFQPSGSARSAGIRTLARRVPAWVWVVLLWAALHVPFAAAPELRSEEGRRGMMARAMLQDGHWIRTTICGQRYIKKPPMLPWMMAASARIIGRLDEWAVRLPALLSMLAAGLAVFGYTRRHAPARSALFAAAAFYLTPLVVEKARIGETDPLVMACSFGAFAAWHTMLDRNPRGLAAWAMAGIILAVGTMAKGPPAVMYFGLGALAWIVWQKRFGHLPRLLLTVAIALAGPLAWAAAVHTQGDTGVWQREMLRGAHFRLGAYLASQAEFAVAAVAGCLPWLILAVPVLAAGWRARRLRRSHGAPPEPLLLAYAGAASLLLLFFPGGEPRYALPAAPAIAVAAGLRFEHLAARGHKAARVLALLVVLAIAGRIAVTAAMPYTDLKHRAAEQIEQAVPRGETIYKLTPGLMNVVFYVDRRVIELTPEEFGRTIGKGIVLLYQRDEHEVASRLKLQPLLRVPMGHGRKDRSFLLARASTTIDE